MDTFRGKKILIMGLGLHGGGLVVANWLISQGADVRITDLKTKKELESSIKKLNSREINLILGKHRNQDFLWAEIVVQNPGVPKESKFLKIARENGALIENEATLFFQIVGRKNIIGITGTRGKSTTTALAYNLLKQKYRKTLIGGNIATSPMFEIINNFSLSLFSSGLDSLLSLPTKKPSTFLPPPTKGNPLLFSPLIKGGRRGVNSPVPVVLELSSWHLENLGEKKLSPRAAVFTNLMADHLNRYRNLNKYLEAKENIFKFQDHNDFSVFNRDNPFTRQAGKKVLSRRFWFSKKFFADEQGCFANQGKIFFRANGRLNEIIKISEIKLDGGHNLENILAAAAIAMIYKVPVKKIRSVLKTFKGLPGRQEFIKEIKGVKFYNDTTSTTPDATIAALKALGGGKKKIILIAGGSDKGIPQEKFNELGKFIKKYCKAVVLFEGQGSEKLKKTLTTYNLQLTTDVKKMVDAVALAKSLSNKGDIVLLSPACASFGLFKHEFDRGNQFVGMVKDLKK